MSAFIASAALASVPQFPDAETIIEAVRELTALGLRVFPMRPGSDQPVDSDWEAGATSHTYAAPDAFKRIADCNLGLALGRASGVFAIVAIGHEGRAALDFLPDFAGDSGTTWEILSPNGEVARLYRFPEAAQLRRPPAYSGLTVLADGDHLSLPPSWTWKGFCAWADGRDPSGPSVASDELVKALFGGPVDHDYSFRHKLAWKARQAIIGGAEALAAAASRCTLDALLSALITGADSADLPRQVVREEWEASIGFVFDLLDHDREHARESLRVNTEEKEDGLE